MRREHGLRWPDLTRHFVCQDLSNQGDYHVVVVGQYTGRQVLIDEIRVTRTSEDGVTSETPMRLIPGTQPPRYEPV